MNESKAASGTDLRALDAHTPTEAEYADLPELTEADFARGTVNVAGKSARRGRPAPNGAKVQVTLRLDRGVVEKFRQTGPGWQSRINAVLDQWDGEVPLLY